MVPAPNGGYLCRVCAVKLAQAILRGPNRAERRRAKRATKKRGNYNRKLKRGRR